MNYTEKYKIGVIKQFEKELNKCEIIYNPNTKGIWFINRETKYWYLEYKIETNYLWWRYEYFNRIKKLFAMTNEVFNKLISEWVENTLNCKVLSTFMTINPNRLGVEDTLNCKVDSTLGKSSVEFNKKKCYSFGCRFIFVHIVCIDQFRFEIKERRYFIV